MYDFNATLEVREQVAAFPDKARPYLDELITFLELTPWNGRSASDKDPDANRTECGAAVHDLDKIVHAVATEPALSPDDLRAVTVRTLVLAGDDDLVTRDHTLALYRALPTAELAVLPNASHLLLMEHAGTVRDIVLAFLTTNAAPTYMPIARADQNSR